MSLYVDIMETIHENEKIRKVPNYLLNKEKRDKIIRVLKEVETGQYIFGEPHWETIAKGEWIEKIRKIINL